MKKKLLILAVAGLALAACSSDETVASQATSEANEISFRPLMTGVTRAADIDNNGLQTQGFTAFAKVNGSGTIYMPETPFTFSAGTYTSEKKYYWPSTGALDFFAYAPSSNSQITGHADGGLAFTVTPSTTISSQVDLVFANTDNKTKAGAFTPNGGSASTYGAAGVPLNFRHAESKIVVKVKNSTVNGLKFEITQMKIKNVASTGTFTYDDTDATTDGNGSGTLTGGWTGNTTYTGSYTTTSLSTNTVTGQVTTGQFLNDHGNLGTEDETLNMILVPQTTPDVTTTYRNSSQNAEYTGSYIALRMSIQNAQNGTVIADATQSDKWAMWPVKFTWEPGKKYTYTIDLAGGGYWETNTNDGNEDLDQILEGAVIKFVDVTVDSWNTTPGETPVGMQRSQGDKGHRGTGTV